MTTFIALYRGDSVAEAKMVAVTAAPDLVREVASRLLNEDEHEEDAVVRELARGRRNALRIVRDGVEG